MMMTMNVKYYAGAALAAALPSRRQVVEQAFTLPDQSHGQRWGWPERLIRFYLAHREGPDDQLEDLHQRFWRSQRHDQWFAATESRTRLEYIPRLGTYVEDVRAVIQQMGITRVVEFGAGNGDWLAYLAEAWPKLQQYIGVDLAEEQMTLNRTRHPQLAFEASDLQSWLSRQGGPNTIYVTNCGVCEYLSEATLRTVLAVAKAQSSGSLWFFVEPIADDFNLESDLHSRRQGHEFSFAHHYPHLLQENGSHVLWHRETRILDCRMLVLLAVL